MGSLLEHINSPSDLRRLSPELYAPLAEEIRAKIIGTVGTTGGHLASNLGVVELTIALLHHFDPPTDKILWDVGHQTYTWKLLTGRRDRFDSLRQPGGISGFPKPSESPCDAFVAGHAGNAISAALGLAAARDRRGGTEHVVAVVGDAAASNGLSFEALNNVAATTRRLIVILNDNEMSICGNVGALSRHLGRLLGSHHYNRVKSRVEEVGHRLRLTFLRKAYHRTETAVKSIFVRNSIFEDLGLRYVGPIDGHNLPVLLDAVLVAKNYDAPIILHVATQKGHGYSPAVQEPEAWHGVPPFDAETGSLPPPKEGGYSEAFGKALAALVRDRTQIAAVTASMRTGTGLEDFARQFPANFHDVGICEGHAVTFAGGLAAGGLRPVVALYSTFLQRAVDNVYHDICIQNLPVVLCLDRAGIVGADGATHHGIFDIALLRPLPNLVMMQPRDTAMLSRMLVTALDRNGPSIIRYPREPGPAIENPDSSPPPLPLGTAEVLLEPPPTAADIVWIWALGDMLPMAGDIAAALAKTGIVAGIVDPRFIKPLDRDLLRRQAATARLFVTIENGVAAGGFGSAVQETLAAEGLRTPTLVFGWPDRIVCQGTSASLRQAHGLTTEAMTAKIRLSCGESPS